MIGQGNFGEVHKAVWRKNGEHINVAVKMQNDMAKEKEKVTFLQEAATMGQFNHPNIVKMFGIVPEEGKSDSCVSTHMYFTQYSTPTHVTHLHMYINMHTHTHACAHIHTHTHMHTHTHTHTYTHTHTHIHEHTHTHTQNAHMHTRAHACIHTHTHTHHAHVCIK